MAVIDDDDDEEEDDDDEDEYVEDVDVVVEVNILIITGSLHNVKIKLRNS